MSEVNRCCIDDDGRKKQEMFTFLFFYKNTFAVPSLDKNLNETSKIGFYDKNVFLQIKLLPTKINDSLVDKNGNDCNSMHRSIKLHHIELERGDETIFIQLSFLFSFSIIYFSFFAFIFAFQMTVFSIESQYNSFRVGHLQNRSIKRAKKKI